MRVTTTACIFRQDKLLVVLDSKKKIWTQVGGHVEMGESLIEALDRECFEETRLHIDVISPIEVTGSEPLPFYVKSFRKGEGKLKNGLSYLARARPGSVVLQEEELLDHRWIDESEIDELDTTQDHKQLFHEAFRLMRDRF